MGIFLSRSRGHEDILREQAFCDRADMRGLLRKPFFVAATLLVRNRGITKRHAAPYVVSVYSLTLPDFPPTWIARLLFSLSVLVPSVLLQLNWLTKQRVFKGLLKLFKRKKHFSTSCTYDGNDLLLFSPPTLHLLSFVTHSSFGFRATYAL